ncbi:hypothetical protein CHS0354_015838 [Potamilus streckersoni]|uniref:C1q domain-containing protein n=1 Tax=Potamilus streckersoni TaxID=2493646 RepID=A0AAE0SDG1_9BIVA|nr:hypothetical protein CHS0354_015838 [Potamilus streckersoni]
MVRKMSLDFIRLANEQRRMNAFKEELLLTIVELQETQKELLDSNAELLKTQNKLISSQSELQNRIKDLEVEAEHCKRKGRKLMTANRCYDRMRRSASTNVGFTARLTNTITSGLNYQQTLVFDNIYINVGNGYDAMTCVYHAPVAGMYVILMTVSSVGDYPSGDVEVVQNGVPICRAVATHLHWGGCPCNAVVHLKVGDAVWVRESYHRPEDYILGNFYTTFSMGFMIKDDGGSSF